ncbi:MAG: potassium channel family protein [Paracoccaceae bacterium]
MRIVIAGASRLGARLATKLVEAGHEVVVIDRDRDRLESLAETLDCGMIEGDASHPSTLRQAANEAGDVFVGLGGQDQDNVLSAVVARTVGFARVIPQVRDTELGEVCDALGLDDVVVPEETMAESLRASIEDGGPASRTAPLTQSFRFGDCVVADRHGGSTIESLGLDRGVRIVALSRRGRDFFADPDTELRAGDRAIFVGEPKALRSARALLVSEDDG